MIHVTADNTLMVKDLAAFIEPVEISDATGRLVGLFVPANLEHGKQLYARLAPQIDLQEIQRRIATQKNGRSLREIFEHLKTLTNDPQEQAHLQKKIDAMAERDRCVTQ